MRSVCLAALNDFEVWRLQARELLRARCRPEEVVWQEPGTAAGLFGDDAPIGEAGAAAVGAVPAAFIALAHTVINHADPERFGLLYRVLWRLQADRYLLDMAADVDVMRLTRMASAVRRDSHKMKAFVRFKEVIAEDGVERFAAWFEPDHYTLEMTAPFFARRFDGMIWAIVTPYRSACWDRKVLSFQGGGRKSDVPDADAVEADWKAYFSAIFNPARLKVAMMKSEMSVKYWRNLPEAELIGPLVRGAREAEQDMIKANASQPPSRHLKQQARVAASGMEEGAIATLSEARQAVNECQRCPLYEQATQPVFGEGKQQAQVMFVGEQPGDQEDLAGKPFVGPAGQVLDRAIEKVGIARETIYLTNAVKHFKFEPRGKRRIHQRPDGGEVAACRFWLDLEISLVRPRLIVALGATAAQSLLGKAVTISKVRGAPIERADGTLVLVTNHPSYLLRIRDPESRAREAQKFEDDLILVRETMARWSD